MFYPTSEQDMVVSVGEVKTKSLVTFSYRHGYTTEQDMVVSVGEVKTKSLVTFSYRHGYTTVGRPAMTCIYQISEDTEYV